MPGGGFHLNRTRLCVENRNRGGRGSREEALWRLRWEELEAVVEKVFGLWVCSQGCTIGNARGHPGSLSSIQRPLHWAMLKTQEGGRQSLAFMDFEFWLCFFLIYVMLGKLFDISVPVSSSQSGGGVGAPGGLLESSGV